ncbi:hypothetical protein B566_EDAN003563 [Ephemera danica]|nr:hypothetical protein B566_EDAN003563 [Ephemera danica]
MQLLMIAIGVRPSHTPKHFSYILEKFISEAVGRGIVARECSQPPPLEYLVCCACPPACRHHSAPRSPSCDRSFAKQQTPASCLLAHDKAGWRCQCVWLEGCCWCCRDRMFATDGLVNQSWIDRTTDWPRANGTSLAVAAAVDTEDDTKTSETTQYGPAASVLIALVLFVDRYYAITKPLEYGVKRTPRRMIACVSLVWLGAACISLPPLLILGNEHGDDAARKIVLEERRAQSHLRLPANTMIPAELNQAPSAPNITDNIVVVTEISKNGTATPETRLASPAPTGEAVWRRERGSTASSSSGGSGRGCSCGRSRRSSKQTQHVSWATCSENAQPTENAARKKLIQHQAPQIMSRTRLRFTLAKERKASTTLGIIMSAFTVCWLPFFVLALVRPFLTNRDGIPGSLSSLFLWLGYANSLLNPIIYATLNKDFRKPFQQILYFRCSSLNLMMREEFYHSQYGDPNLTIAGPTTRHRAIGEETEPELRVLRSDNGEPNNSNEQPTPRPSTPCVNVVSKFYLQNLEELRLAAYPYDDFSIVLADRSFIHNIYTRSDVISSSLSSNLETPRSSTTSHNFDPGNNYLIPPFLSSLEDR